MQLLFFLAYIFCSSLVPNELVHCVEDDTAHLGCTTADLLLKIVRHLKKTKPSLGGKKGEGERERERRQESTWCLDWMLCLFSLCVSLCIGSTTYCVHSQVLLYSCKMHAELMSTTCMHIAHIACTCTCTCTCIYMYMYKCRYMELNWRWVPSIAQTRDKRMEAVCWYKDYENKTIPDADYDKHVQTCTQHVRTCTCRQT